MDALQRTRRIARIARSRAAQNRLARDDNQLSHYLWQLPIARSREIIDN
jgi:hypothetical protein